MTDSPALRHGKPEHLMLREELRQATRTEHDQLEAALDLMRPDLGIVEYRELLMRYHGFYHSFEGYMREQADPLCRTVRFYAKGRWKQPWLQEDLRTLNHAAAGNAHFISAEVFASFFPASSYLLGAIYVIEGSMLGGMVLSRHFSRNLGLTPETGLRFFTGYGASTKAHWEALLQLLEECDGPDTRRDEIVLGAKRMFSLLQRQLIEGVTVW